MADKSPTSARSIFAGDLWLPYNFDPPQQRFERFLKAGRSSLGFFVHAFMLYDRVVLPTQDFLGLTTLVHTFGEKNIHALVEEGLLSFVRVKGSFGYHRELIAFSILDEASKPDHFAAETETALAWALGAGPVRVSDNAFLKRILSSTEQVESSSFAESLGKETARDLRDSATVRNELDPKNIGPNGFPLGEELQVRIYGGPLAGEWRDDVIDRFNALAFANLELRLSENAKCTDSTSSSPVGHALRAKAERLGGTEAAASFTALREVADVPDIGEAVIQGQAEFKQILRLRTSRDGAAFREWFHTNCRDNPQSTARVYARMLKEVPLLGTLPLRILRILIPGAAVSVLFPDPVAGFAVGSALSVADSFLLERWARRPSPKVFLEQLTKLGEPRNI